MTARQRELIRHSFAAVAEEADAVGLLFYGRLFELDPSLRALFACDMQAQSQKLMETLSSLLASLDNLSAVEPTLQALGQRHASYNLQAHHYATVCSAMEWAVAQALEEDPQGEAVMAWKELLQTVGAVMLSGVEARVG